MKINVILNKIPQKSETFLISWMHELSLNGYNVRAIIIGNWYFKKRDRQKMIPNIEYYSKGNLTLFFLTLFRSIHRLNIGSSFRELLITRGKPDIVHFSYSAIAVNYINEITNLKSNNIAFLVSCRGTSDNIKPYLNDNRAILLKSLFKVIDLVHCVSQEMLDRMERDFGLDINKGFVNRPAIDTNKFQAITNTDFDESGKIVILSTGRLEYVKGFIFALMAIKELIFEGFNVEYRILGYGSEEEALKFYCNRLEIQSNVKLLGGMDHNEVIKEIKSANIYLSSSLSEGISNAVLEAMAMGVPVVSTNIGGMPEVVLDDATGILVNPYESSAIASALKKLILDSNLRNKVAMNGKLLIENEYNLTRLFNVFDRNYKKLA
jgi:colanic acid/amylovoran biosynthesis glycosyltransferase